MQKITKKNLLPTIAPYLPCNPLIVEAGAFTGKDSLFLHAFWPEATLHVFEPVTEIFELLCETVRPHPNIHTHPYALGAHTGNAPMHISAHPDKPGRPYPAASLLAPKERLSWSKVTYPSTRQVATITLDDWAVQQAIDRIDFLWLDVQGYALPILQASLRILATVRVIYVEVEFIEAYEHQKTYLDVKAWLEQHGFSMIGQDFDDMQQWFFGNALFIR